MSRLNKPEDCSPKPIYGKGNGSGAGSKFGTGTGDGYGYDHGSGRGDEAGHGDGSGIGDGYGEETGHGTGEGSGSWAVYNLNNRLRAKINSGEFAQKDSFLSSKGAENEFSNQRDTYQRP